MKAIALRAAVPAGVGQVKLVFGAGDAHVEEAAFLPATARSPSSITRWCGNMPPHRPIRKTTDHSSPAWWMVDRVTAPPERSAAALSSSRIAQQGKLGEEILRQRSENPARQEVLPALVVILKGGLHVLVIHGFIEWK